MRTHRRKTAKLKLLNCYGATETTSPAAIMPPDETVARKEFVGLAVSSGDILVMDSEGVEPTHGQPGDIYIGGAMVVPGYFNNPEATEREFVAGYWKSGDLGIMDEKGYLPVIDRVKDVINWGGFKIYASEIENVLLEHPAVVEVEVAAKPCPVLGERVHEFQITQKRCGPTKGRFATRLEKTGVDRSYESTVIRAVTGRKRGAAPRFHRTPQRNGSQSALQGLCAAKLRPGRRRGCSRPLPYPPRRSRGCSRPSSNPLEPTFVRAATTGARSSVLSANRTSCNRKLSHPNASPDSGAARSPTVSVRRCSTRSAP
jgi:hypothetical protein